MQTAVQAAELQPAATPWTEDWLAVVIGLLIFVLSLGVLGGADILGWVVTTSIWTDVSKALAPATKTYAGLGGVGALIATYVAMVVLMTAGAAALRLDVNRLALAFRALLSLGYLWAFLGHEPMVAGAWMGLAVKTDGAALASGGITEALILSNAAAQGINYQKGWILGTTAAIKVFIDIFIGIWAFILAYIWTRHINV